MVLVTPEAHKELLLNVCVFNFAKQVLLSQNVKGTHVRR